jgi:hypothetical protein
MQATTSTPEILSPSTAQRRGKIARLPRPIRDEINVRLDDGQEAEEILAWLNALPEVRQAIAKYFNGIPISPQNLSAWRRGGFQEWLFQQQFLDTALQMRENVAEVQQEIDSENPGEIHRTMADYLASHLAIRLSAFMGRWDGAPTPEHKALLKTGALILKVQAACQRARLDALDQPAQSSSIKVAKGSATSPDSLPKSPERTVIQTIEFTADHQNPSQRPKIPLAV